MDNHSSDLRVYDHYVFSPDGRIIVRWEKLEAPDNRTALKAARAPGFKGLQELWRGETLVRRWT